MLEFLDDRNRGDYVDVVRRVDEDQVLADDVRIDRHAGNRVQHRSAGFRLTCDAFQCEDGRGEQVD